jgi:NADPH-dependent curcumin reductase CurA
MFHWYHLVQCGSISQSSLDPSTVYRLGNLPQVVARRLTLRGFIVSDPDFGPKYRNEQLEKLGKWIKDGEVKVLMHITEGMENAAEGFVGMLEGKNYGKAILKLADI